MITKRVLATATSVLIAITAFLVGMVFGFNLSQAGWVEDCSELGLKISAGVMYRCAPIAPRNNS